MEITEIIIETLLGILLIVFAYLIGCKGQIQLLHSYHYQNVSEEDKKALYPKDGNRKLYPWHWYTDDALFEPNLYAIGILYCDTVYHSRYCMDDCLYHKIQRKFIWNKEKIKYPSALFRKQMGILFFLLQGIFMISAKIQIVLQYNGGCYGIYHRFSFLATCICGV